MGHGEEAGGSGIEREPCQPPHNDHHSATTLSARQGLSRSELTIPQAQRSAEKGGVAPVYVHRGQQGAPLRQADGISTFPEGRNAWILARPEVTGLLRPARRGGALAWGPYLKPNCGGLTMCWTLF